MQQFISYVDKSDVTFDNKCRIKQQIFHFSKLYFQQTRFLMDNAA